ncbi:MAG: hypothetical protein C6P37_00215 [Caldibacillus debilis]|uniref:Uncharacterized protein n=1 Tax=Caldibacillus debilis TaxID=301148 RepID=A0A3E0K8S3_9BACI|nr:hypothetical protein [Bacillaceae bacterium]MBY6272013.1 hypothetical protein [Bacillaceae bacterium]REJ14620.1 MAG: hypothetical protein C6W57_13550 [Caldibacillus debilis]REJ26436.1 MAG: hypothetical protein C6W56_12015 [Caldibacillus debilis]REJ31614.1 MAG: hypothetical protein C6P37_00215 [Caldibacillus debilis]
MEYPPEGFPKAGRGKAPARRFPVISIPLRPFRICRPGSRFFNRRGKEKKVSENEMIKKF